MRPLWKSAPSFDLVNIPVVMYPATTRIDLVYFEQPSLMDALQVSLAARPAGGGAGVRKSAAGRRAAGRGAGGRRAS